MPDDGVARRKVRRLPADGGGAAPVERTDEVIVEEPLEIRLAGDGLAITMRTPGHDAELALGFLFAEGIIASIDDVSAVRRCEAGEPTSANAVDVIPVGGVSPEADRIVEARRGTLTTSACGVCGRARIDDLIARCGTLPAEPRIPRAVLAAATGKLAEAQALFARTGGCHAAVVLDAAGRVLVAREDVGRHNAVDKVVGALLQSRAIGPKAPREGAPAILAVSGRASFEIVQKAAVARIPVVASVSAASSLAIDLAASSGVTLAAFAREGELAVYAHPERIAD